MDNDPINSYDLFGLCKEGVSDLILNLATLVLLMPNGTLTTKSMKEKIR